MPIKNWKKDPPPEDPKFWTPAILNTINRRDTITWRLAQTYFEKEKPALLYISLMETDLEGHKGRYDLVLDALHRLDSLVGNLWLTLQNDPEYAGRTALFMTTDHGRGHGGFMSDWRLHNHLTRGSQHIWCAVIGPDVPAFGEVAGTGKALKAKQFARTIAALVGQDFDKKGRGQPIDFDSQISAHFPPDRERLGTRTVKNEAQPVSDEPSQCPDPEIQKPKIGKRE